MPARSGAADARAAGNPRPAKGTKAGEARISPQRTCTSAEWLGIKHAVALYCKNRLSKEPDHDCEWITRDIRNLDFCRNPTRRCLGGHLSPSLDQLLRLSRARFAACATRAHSMRFLARPP
jgi:hypothetical protein